MQLVSPRLSISPLILALISLTLLSLFIRAQLSPVAALDESAPESVFSSARAYKALEYLTKEQVPHTVDTAANRVVESRIVELLRGMGYKEEIQDTQICRETETGYAICSRVRNIIVTVKGKETGKGILLAAHYDSGVVSPGASDAGSAVATLLESARLLKQLPQPNNTIVFLFNEGEEIGLMGARAFMEQHPLAKQIQVAINIEARGSSGKSVMFETGEDSGWLVDIYAQTTPAPLSSSLFYEIYKFLPNDTDLTVFKEHGLQGLNFAYAERLPHYHTPYDNLKNLDKGSLQHHGDNVWGVLNSLRNADLASAYQGNLVYADMMGLFVLSWQESLTPSIAIFVLVMLLATLFFLLKKQALSKVQLFRASITIFLIVFISVIAAYLITWVAQVLSGNDEPWHINGLPLRAAIWIGALIGGIHFAKWMLKRSSPLEASIALALIWTLLSLASSIFMAGVSILFLIPAFTTIVGVLVYTGLSYFSLSERQLEVWRTVCLVIVCLISSLNFIATAYVLEIMVTFKLAVVVGVFLGFAVATLLPFLALKTESNRGLTKTSSGLAIVMLIGLTWSCIQPAQDALIPQHLNLGFVQNEQDESHVFIGYQKASLSPELIDAIGTQLEPKQIIPWTKFQFSAAPVQAQHFDKTILRVLDKTKTELGIDLLIEIKAPPKDFAELELFVANDSGLVSISKGKDTINYLNEVSRRPDYYELRCIGDSCASQVLTLRFKQDPPEELLIGTVLADLPEAYRSLKDKRGQFVVPVFNGDRSFIVSRHRL